MLNKIKLFYQIRSFREKSQHNHTWLIITIIIILSMMIGYQLGKYNTIYGAKLLNVEDGYYIIGYGDEAHLYTFEEVR